MTILVAALVSALLTRGLLALAARGSALIPLDRPNQRSLHVSVVPRAGGLAVLATFLLLAGRQAAHIDGLLAGLAIVAAVSYFDDLRGLSPGIRLAAHLAASIIVAWALSGSAWALLVALCIAGFANIVNFMDGANGVVAGCMAIAFAVLGQVGLLTPSPGLAELSFALAGAAAGFLVLNLSGRIFLGDAGSVSLGFLYAALSAFGFHAGVWPLEPCILAALPMLIDALSTLVRRAIRRQHIWLPHREHLYQRLIECGWSHRRVAVSYGLATLVAGGLGLLTLHAANETRIGVVLAAGTVALAIHDYGLRCCARKRRAAPANDTDA